MLASQLQEINRFALNINANKKILTQDFCKIYELKLARLHELSIIYSI